MLPSSARSWRRSEMLFPVDLARFWADNDVSLDRPFSTDKPQVPMTLRTTEGCLWEELGIPEDSCYHREPELHVQLNRRYNEKALEIIGRKMLRETFVPLEDQPPRPMRIEEMFGSSIVRISGSGSIREADWVVESIHTIGELEEWMGHVESLVLEEVLFPRGFSDALQRLRIEHSVDVPLGGGIRGPVTAATSKTMTRSLPM